MRYDLQKLSVADVNSNYVTPKDLAILKGQKGNFPFYLGELDNDMGFVLYVPPSHAAFMECLDNAIFLDVSPQFVHLLNVFFCDVVEYVFLSRDGETINGLPFAPSLESEVEA